MTIKYIKIQTPLFLKVITCCSITLLLSSSLIIFTVIQQMPLINLAIAQARYGSIDLQLKPVFMDSLNNTRIEQILETKTNPRINTNGKIKFSDKQLYASIILMDFETQKENGLGDSFFGQNLKGNQVYVSQQFECSKGQKILVSIYIQNIVKNLAIKLNQLNQSFDVNQSQNIQNYIEKQFIVKKIFDSSHGKVNQINYKQMLYFDIKSLFIYLFQNKSSYFENFIYNTNFKEFSHQVILQYKNRQDLYMNSNADEIGQTILQWANYINQKLGIYAIDVSTPVYKTLKRLNSFSMFIGLLLNIIIICLFILNIFVMYNMMQIGIQKKKYQLGILRLLGSTNLNLIYNILSIVLIQIIYGSFFSIVISYFTLKHLPQLFKQFIIINKQIYPTFKSIILTSLLGTIVPILSSIIPSSQFFRKDILAAIKTQQNKVNPFKVEITQIGKSIGWSKLTFALLASLEGIFIFFLLPMALIKLNLSLLFTIFMVLLVGLLFGLIIVTYNLETYLQKLICYIFLFWMNSSTMKIVLKNLEIHREKNLKSYLMYSLAIGFIILLWMGFQVNLKSIKYEFQYKLGSQIRISSYYSLHKNRLDNILNGQLKPLVQSHSYISKQLSNIISKNIVLSDLGRTKYIEQVLIYSASPNYLDSVFKQNIIIDSTLAKNKNMDPFRYLYTEQGANSAIIGSFHAQQLGIKVGDDILLRLIKNGIQKRFTLKVSTIMQKCPGFSFSKFRYFINSFIISFKTFEKLAQLSNVQNYYLNQMVIKTQKNKIKQIEKGIKKHFNHLRFHQITDHDQVINKINEYVDLVFYIIIFIFMFICFFSLITSVTGNILMQTKQIAILRMIGITKSKINFIYIFETFTVVLSSCIFGMLVGMVIGYTLNAQKSLLTDIPSQLSIPYKIFFEIMVISLGISILSTFGPIASLVSMPISTIYKIR